jgi:hypothetical protein
MAEGHAASHFSYHVSAGQFVLCDLQGGVYSNAVVLVLIQSFLSRGKLYGVTDLGPRGISSFFSNHRCNEFFATLVGQGLPTSDSLPPPSDGNKHGWILKSMWSVGLGTPCCDGRREDFLCMLIGHDPASISDFPPLLRTTDKIQEGESRW